MDSPSRNIRLYILLPFFAFAIFMIFIMAIMKVNHGNFTAFISWRPFPSFLGAAEAMKIWLGKTVYILKVS